MATTAKQKPVSRMTREEVMDAIQALRERLERDEITTAQFKELRTPLGERLRALF